MTRIAFAADLHVDDFGSRVNPETGANARFEDALEAVGFIAQTARDRDAAALVVAGDYTERRSPAPPRVARIVEQLQRGPARQVHVRGNHDSERGGRSIVNVLSAIDGWDGYTVPGVSLVDDVAICVIPFLAPSHLRSQPGLERAAPAEIYRLLGEQYLTMARGIYATVMNGGAKSAILVGHQQLAGGRMNDSQASFLGDLDVVIDSRALASIGYAAVVFGHVHKAQTVVDDPACPVLFAGSAHRVDFAEADEDKSFVMLDVIHGRGGGRIVNIERVPIPARRFVTITGENVDTVPPSEIADAIVRVVDVDPSHDVAGIRAHVEALGAFEVQEIRPRAVVREESAATIAEGLTAHEALEEYFAGDNDAEALVELGRRILAEVAG